MAQPETMDDHEDTATLQLREEGDSETVVDETGALKEAGDAVAVAGEISDPRVQQWVQRQLADGKTNIVVDLSQREASPEVLAQLEQLRRKLHEDGAHLKVLVDEAADLQKVEVKEMQATGAQVADNKHATKVLENSGETLAA